MRTIIFLSFSLSIILLASCERNSPPIITGIESSTETFEEGEIITLSCIVIDEDGDDLIITWSALYGSFPSGASGASVQWKAPSESGDFNLVVRVEDPVSMQEDSITINIWSENGSFIDQRDDNIYAYTTIGTQIWMAENLAYLPKVNPSSGGSDTQERYYVYDYQGSDLNEVKGTDNYNDYGALYNWEAARDACPKGWHLPTDHEWRDLTDYLGLYAGFNMKSVSGWNDHDNQSGNGDNSSGFNGFPAGIRSSGAQFKGQGYYSTFWSNSAEGLIGNWSRRLDNYQNGLPSRQASIVTSGLSVRCVKDLL